MAAVQGYWPSRRLANPDSKAGGRWKDVERCGKMWKDYTTETLARCSRTVWAKSSKLPVDHSHADIATHTEPIAAALTPNAATTKKTIAAAWGFFQYVLDIDILLGSTEHVLVGRGWENFNATISCLHPFSLKNPEDMRRYNILHYSVVYIMYIVIHLLYYIVIYIYIILYYIILYIYIHVVIFSSILFFKRT